MTSLDLHHEDERMPARNRIPVQVAVGAVVVVLLGVLMYGLFTLI